MFLELRGLSKYSSWDCSDSRTEMIQVFCGSLWIPLFSMCFRLLLFQQQPGNTNSFGKMLISSMMMMVIIIRANVPFVIVAPRPLQQGENVRGMMEPGYRVFLS